MIQAHPSIKHGHQHEELIQQLRACVNACNNLLAETDGSRMLGDCAEICALTAKLLATESEYSHELLIICQKICAQCALECSVHSEAKFKECADECGKCGEACKAHFSNIEYNSIH
jgi:hypothetical protein